MGASRLALCALAVALAVGGCGTSDSTYTAVQQTTTATQATTTTPADTATDTAAASPLAGLPAPQQQALAALADAQAALEQRGNAVANAGTAADKVVQRIGSGYTPPAGPRTPEVRRLADALDAFGTALAPIATDPTLLPQLAAQLRQSYSRSVKSHPAAAARLLAAKQQVDAIVQTLPALQQTLRTATARARAQASATKLDAQTLDSVIQVGSESATSALNGVDQAMNAGIRALAAAKS
jgi:hypothetical protein